MHLNSLCVELVLDAFSGFFIRLHKLGSTDLQCSANPRFFSPFYLSLFLFPPLDSVGVKRMQLGIQTAWVQVLAPLLVSFLGQDGYLPSVPVTAYVKMG